MNEEYNDQEKLYFHVDWDKVETVEDLKVVLRAFPIPSYVHMTRKDIERSDFGKYFKIK